MAQVAAKRAGGLATPARQQLLRTLVLSSLSYSPQTALFFSERLYALDSTVEQSVYLIALVLAKNNRQNEALWVLRQPVASRNGNAKTTSKPALECSVRCARLYASCCLALGREKEGRDVLAKAAALPPSPPDSAFDLASFPPHLADGNEAWVLELEMARLARAGGEHERAVQGFRKVLEGNAWCWEAIEGLCAEGAPPDADVLFPPRPRLPQSAPISPLPAAASRTLPTAPATHPPPLGPSQTFAVNSVQHSNGRMYASGAGAGEGLGFFTPSDAAASGGPGGKAKDGKGMFGFAGGMNLWKKGGGRGTSEVVEMSVDDSSTSFDNSFYPSQPPPPLSFGPASHLPANAHASGSNSLFTPPALSVAPAPGVKRARGQQLPLSTPQDEDIKPSRRVVRGVPDTRKHDSSSVPTRRSARISKESSAAPSSSSMSQTRSQQSRAPTMRDKKRSKAGAGPSVLSDAGSEPLSPTSHSSSPAPSSPGGSHAQAQILAVLDPAVQEAEDYVAGTLRAFGRAAACAALFESAKAIEALMGLPVEQQRSWRCLVGVGRAHMEMLNYDKAEKAFSQARATAPHLLDSMELYSTLLWHLRLPTALSFLAQDLMAIAPRSPSSWIASGNVFSHLEDHGAALKCFKRAAQLEQGCVYAYTLSGHECVVLEEWERALGFFREAVRRDPRHYNAWFGLGNVYMQTGKYRLAEYHFRKAVEINPTNATLVCCIGSVLEKLGRRREALELYEKACLLAPESPAVRFKRVRILISLKQYQVAESDLLNLKDRAPNEFNVHFLLGKLYKASGREAEMAKAFALAQDLDPRAAALIREHMSAETMEVDTSTA